VPLRWLLAELLRTVMDMLEVRPRPPLPCSTFATATLARAQTILGNDSVALLGPSTILLKNNFTFQLPIVVRATNQTGEAGQSWQC
jgi:hypothetical protein